MRKIDRMSKLPEVTRCTKYYEHDGLLRAYANRAMLLAMIFGVLAMASLGFAIYVRLQPPTVIRVDSDGNASVVGGPRAGKVATFSLFADASSAHPSPGVAPTDLEGRAVVRHFLDRYLTYTPDSVDRNLAEALNMMTANLRVYSMNKLRDEDTQGGGTDNAWRDAIRLPGLVNDRSLFGWLACAGTNSEIPVSSP